MSGDQFGPNALLQVNIILYQEVKMGKSCGCCENTNRCPSYFNAGPNLEPATSSDGWEFVFLICNSNKIADDDFEIIVNGLSIGNISFNANTPRSAIFGTSKSAIEKLKKKLNSNACIKNIILEKTISRTIFDTLETCGGSELILMKNIKNNRMGNLGIFQIYAIQSNLICLFLDQSYTAVSGKDIELSWTFCGFVD